MVVDDVKFNNSNNAVQVVRPHPHQFTLLHSYITFTSLWRLCDCMWVCFDPRERTICGLATVASSVSNMEFGTVERALSKKLNSILSSSIKAKLNPDMCIDLTIRRETSTCVADAANWANGHSSAHCCLPNDKGPGPPNIFPRTAPGCCMAI